MEIRSFQAKRIWAKQHQDTLRQEIMDFRRSEPCVIVKNFDPERLEHTWRIQGEPLQPPPEISLRLGDVLYNYRSTLDHLAWDLVIASGGTPTWRTAFPICQTEAHFKGRRSQDGIDGMTEEIRVTIEELQPYKRPYFRSTNHILGLLDRLGNVEKHRHFNVITASVDLASFNIDEDALEDHFVHKGPVEDGTVIARAKGKMDVKFAALFGIAFGQGEEVRGELVDEFLIRLDLAVEEVVGEFWRFLFA